MKRLAIFGVVVALLLALLPVAASASPGTVWHVDDDLVDYPDADYTTIQAAVDAASPGDTIIVHPGTYEENVNVAKSVTIDGQGAATLIAGIEYWTGKRGDGFRVTASDVTITGFTIIGHYGGVEQGFNNPGIVVGGNYPGDMAHLGVQRVTISNNVFRDSWSAIYVWKSSDNLITGNTIYNMDWRAIQVYDGSWDAQIEEGYPSQNNRIIDNEVYNSWGGLYVGAWGPDSMRHTDNSGTIVQGNYFHDLTDFAVGFGFTDSTDVVISGNAMVNNIYGICVYGWWVPGGLANLTGTTVTGNTIDSNSYGILIVTGNQWTIENNDITNSGTVGVYVMESKGIEVHHNNIVDNQLYGVSNSIGDDDPEQWVVDATLNWWGDKRGPSRTVGEAKGHAEVKGAKVSPNVWFAPWLKQPIDS